MPQQRRVVNAVVGRGTLLSLINDILTVPAYVPGCSLLCGCIKSTTKATAVADSQHQEADKLQSNACELNILYGNMV
ncbi:unnamed protein product [Ceratitis capitata]|uniref:(Mediterranean fruit fly) hypothetical protein n=1 Tax=Ceratitis capitata TaxID=7213 RepID=A0A811U3Q2_CERCA|nr:unnamed protein product [Ceratitis capitata]